MLQRPCKYSISRQEGIPDTLTFPSQADYFSYPVLVMWSGTIPSYLIRIIIYKFTRLLHRTREHNYHLSHMSGTYCAIPYLIILDISIILHRNREHSHHPNRGVHRHCGCWGCLHSQLHCGVRVPSSSELDRSRWEPSEWQWGSNWWACVPSQNHLHVTEVSFSTYIPSRAVHLPVHCAINQNSNDRYSRDW